MPVDLKFLLYLISRFLTHFCLHFKSYFLVFQGLELIYYQAAKTEKHENSRYKALFLAQHIAALLQRKSLYSSFSFLRYWFTSQGFLFLLQCSVECCRYHYFAASGAKCVLKKIRITIYLSRYLHT